jgi:hypothetical protein
MLAVPPLAFVKTDESEAVLILHLGRSLCGHDGIIHGGMIATIFDEALGRNVRTTMWFLVRLGKKADGFSLSGSSEYSFKHWSYRDAQHAVQEAHQG